MEITCTPCPACTATGGTDAEPCVLCDGCGDVREDIADTYRDDPEAALAERAAFFGYIA